MSQLSALPAANRVCIPWWFAILDMRLYESLLSSPVTARSCLFPLFILPLTNNRTFPADGAEAPDQSAEVNPLHNRLWRSISGGGWPYRLVIRNSPAYCAIYAFAPTMGTTNRGNPSQPIWALFDYSTRSCLPRPGAGSSRDNQLRPWSVTA